MESAHRSYFHTGEQLNGSCLQHAKLFQHLLFLSVCYNKLSTTVVWREFRSFLPFERESLTKRPASSTGRLVEQNVLQNEVQKECSQDALEWSHLTEMTIKAM